MVGLWVDRGGYAAHQAEAMGGEGRTRGSSCLAGVEAAGLWVEGLVGCGFTAPSGGEGRGLSSKRSLRPSMTGDALLTAMNS